MGWLFQRDPIDRAYIERNIVPVGAMLIDHSRQGAKHWLLIEVATAPEDNLTRDFEPDRDGRVRFIALVLTQTDRCDAAYRHGYKAIDETMGPTELSCPLRLINTASPRRADRYEWRKSVLAWHDARRREASRLVPGEIIEFDTPMRFTNGAEYRRFIVIYRQSPFSKKRVRRFRVEGSDAVYSISHLNRRSYRVIRPAGGQSKGSGAAN